MISNLNRPPTKIEKAVAIVVSALASAAFGAVTAFLLLKQPGEVVAAIIFSALFLGSVTLLFRAAFTARRSLSARETRGLSWLLIVGGLIGAPLTFLLPVSAHQIMLLGASLSSIGYGLAGLSHRREA